MPLLNPHLIGIIVGVWSHSVTETMYIVHLIYVHLSAHLLNSQLSTLAHFIALAEDIAHRALNDGECLVHLGRRDHEGRSEPDDVLVRRLGKQALLLELVAHC